jgi:hypothetical protein
MQLAAVLMQPAVLVVCTEVKRLVDPEATVIMALGSKPWTESVSPVLLKLIAFANAVPVSPKLSDRDGVTMKDGVSTEPTCVPAPPVWATVIE